MSGKTGVPRLRHGHNPAGSPSRTYRSWKSMKDRCRLACTNRYENYGGKGISFCKRWDSFENFLADMGERPPNKTLDRIDPSKDYQPDNCRWADIKTQNRNRRASRRSTTGISGVLSRGKRWEVTLAASYMGSFTDFFEACCARKSAEERLWRS